MRQLALSARTAANAHERSAGFSAPLRRTSDIVPTQKSIRALAPLEMSSLCFAGLPRGQVCPTDNGNQRAGSRWRSRRQACGSSFAAGEVAASQAARRSIPMVESAEDRQAHDLHSTFGSVDFPAIRCVLAEREMGAGLVVVDAVGAKQVPCVSLVEDDHVVEYFSPDGADDAFGEGVLPR